MADFTINLTGTVEVDDSIKEEFEANAILEYTQNNVVDQVVQYQRDIGAKSISLPRYPAIPVTETPLNEREDVDSYALSDSEILFTPAEYGQVVTTTNLADLQTGGTVTRAAAGLLGKNMGETTNTHGTRALEASANVYIPGAGTEAGLTDTDIMNADVMNTVYNKLARQNVPTMEGGLYVAFMHDDVIHDLRADASPGSWVDVTKYSMPMIPLRNEVGMFKGFRIIRNNNCLITADGGSGTVDSYRSSFVGWNGLGQAESQVPEMRVTGPYDKLGRFLNMGWYGVYEYKIVEPDAVWVAITASSVGDNA